MRVALLSASAPAGNAIGNQLAEKVAFFLDHGHEVRAFLQSAQALHPGVRPCVTVVAAAQLSAADWAYLTSADLILVDYSQAYPLLDLLPLLAPSRARILFDYHGVTPPQLWTLPNREALEQAAQQRGLVWCAAAALAHSRFACRELHEATGFPVKGGLGYVIDTEFFAPGPPAQALRARLGLQEATLLLFVGRLAPNKRVPLLVEALAQLRDCQPPVHAVVIGPAHDVYAVEAARCRQRAAELGVAERWHLLGQIEATSLRDAYRSADVFVMPSVHEGFCLPVLEAMACGLPVVAARAGALPETVGPAGLTFVPDDAVDLAQQIRRVLDPGRASESQHAIAIVACRFGPEVVGGAEASLRTLAETLQEAGQRVEVFTTCAQSEDGWHHEAAPGTTTQQGMPIHRFALAPRDPERHRAAQEEIVSQNGNVPPEIEHDFLTNSLRSEQLIEALRSRSAEFDAVLVGPYLFGLTRDVARAFPAKTLLLPCFHDEPTARLPGLRDAYAQVAGILYHSPEEQSLAESDLGLNHPGAVVSGTCLTSTAGNPGRGQQLVGSRRYLVYCGRYSPHKNLPLLLDYARRYATAHPDRFAFAFAGRGSVPIPAEPWARDLGPVAEAERCHLLAGAAALVQLSCLESLSLVALEAWAQGVPIVAHAECRVLVGQLSRCGGGLAVSSYAAFAAALDDLWEQPSAWQERGRQGQAYVREHYENQAAFTARLCAAIADINTPLADRLRRQGLLRAQAHSRSAWRQQFARIIEEVLDAGPRPVVEKGEVQPRLPCPGVPVGLPALVVPVRVSNHGSLPFVPAGPAQTVLRWQVTAEGGQDVATLGGEAPLPGLILPGQVSPAALLVTVPQLPGAYQLTCWAEKASQLVTGTRTVVPLLVEAATSCTSPPSLLTSVQTALVAAQQLQQLPADYLDVTEGWLASWKRWLKSKLLHNFRRAYVDIAFRQQSAFNRQLLQVVQELLECWSVQEHAARQGKTPVQRSGEDEAPAEPQAARLGGSLTLPALATPSSARPEDLVEEVAALRSRCAALEERLARVERLLTAREAVPT